MRELRALAAGEVTWATAAEPDLRGPNSALVRPVAVATCDFDHLMVSGTMPVALPLPIGHECVAIVVSVGADVRSVRTGDTVVLPFQISCGTCAPCRRGHTSSCAALPWLSCYGLGAMAGNWGGLMSDLALVPYADAMLVPLPAGVSPSTAAAAGCNLVDAFNTVGPALESHPGADVLVCGGAFTNIALYSVMFARALGASRVDFLHPDPAVCAKAERLGARVIDSLEHVESLAYPVTVDASMNPLALAAAIRATAPAGVCTASTMYVGEPATGLTALPLMSMFERCITFRTGQPHARGLLEAVLALVADGRCRPETVTDDVVDWEDAPAAFSAGSGKHICTRSC